MSQHYEACPVSRYYNHGGFPGPMPDLPACTCAEEAKKTCPGCGHHVGDHGLHRCHREGCACTEFPFGWFKTEATKRWRGEAG